MALKNKKEIKKLLEEINTLYYPTNYILNVIVDGQNNMATYSDNDSDIIVNFYIDTEVIKHGKS